MLVLALYVPLIRYWYNGPFWPQNGIEKDYCSDSWWKNILYINNFWGAQDTVRIFELLMKMGTVKSHKFEDLRTRGFISSYQ